MTKTITLEAFKPRDYQIPIVDAFENKHFKKMLLVMPRRSGKDFVCFNLIIREACRNIGVYFYCLPTFKQARLVIFDSITNDGKKFLSMLPDGIVESINISEMKIKLINGSIIQLIGSDTYDTSLVGTNPRMIVFSEYALSDERAYTVAARPILNANDGKVILISTPRGHNSLYDLYNIALRHPKDWFCYKLTLDDTKHISWQEIQKEIASGEISEDLALQEYFCSFDTGVEGSYYSKYLDKMKLEGRIGEVPWDASFAVHTAWDLGVSDSTTITMFQVIGTTIRIIDCYSNHDVGLEHYIKVLKEKPYIYGKHIAPHDIQVREWAGGAITRRQKARELGINFTLAPNLSVMEGIEAVRSTFSRMYIDEKKCEKLVRALESYRREYDSKKKVYHNQPLHDWASHYSDSMRYLCLSLPKTKDGMTKEDLDKNYREAYYGSKVNFPDALR